MKNRRMKNQVIKYNRNGDAYITYYGMKVYFNEIMRTQDQNGKPAGIYTLSNNASLIVYIDDIGENAKVKLITM